MMDEKISLVKSLTDWFERLAALPKAIISIVAIAGTISGYMALHDKKVVDRVVDMYEAKDNWEQVKAKLNDIEDKMVIKSELKIFADSIDEYNARIEDKVNEVIKSQNALRESHVKLVDLQIKEKDVWRELLNGIEWVVSPIENKKTDNVDFQIKMRKIQ